MKRTTIRLDEQLLAEAKALAARTGRTLTALIQDSLRESLVRRDGPRLRTRVQLPVFDGRGLMEGVDLDDSSALLDLMEGRDGTS